jgi:DNA-binding transcriptional LysR family regulator
MKLEWLRAFSAVMRSGTVTGASSIILRTQPQVSRMVGALEQQLGLKLFRREGRRLVPTPEALEFNQFIDPVLRSLDNLDNVATDISKKRSRHIAIAAEPFLLHVLVPEAISRAATRDDGRYSIDICVRGLGLWMSRSDVDLAVVALPFAQTDLQQIVFAEAQCVAVLPPGHPLTKQNCISLDELSGDNFIALRASTLLRAQIDMAAVKAGVTLNSRLEAMSGVNACEFVARGLGVTIADPIVALSFAPRGVAVKALQSDLPLSYGFLVSGSSSLRGDVNRVMADVAGAAQRLGKNHIKLASAWSESRMTARRGRK